MSNGINNQLNISKQIWSQTALTRICLNCLNYIMLPVVNLLKPIIRKPIFAHFCSLLCHFVYRQYFYDLPLICGTTLIISGDMQNTCVISFQATVFKNSITVSTLHTLSFVVSFILSRLCSCISVTSCIRLRSFLLSITVAVYTVHAMLHNVRIFISPSLLTSRPKQCDHNSLDQQQSYMMLETRKNSSSIPDFLIDYNRWVLTGYGAVVGVADPFRVNTSETPRHSERVVAS